jgi:hypothetical protein
MRLTASQLAALVDGMDWSRLHAIDVARPPPLAYPASLSQYTIYSAPDPAYVTGRINVSAFANLGASTPWPFGNTNVPLNGHVCVPRGRGPFPLAVFAHGNHNPFENSTPGYLYLCQLLASHGIIAATIDVNFLNGFNFGENDGRAIVHLEHLKQFRTWNNTASHPLHGKIDLNRILIWAIRAVGKPWDMPRSSIGWPQSAVSFWMAPPGSVPIASACPRWPRSLQPIGNLRRSPGQRLSRIRTS